MSDVRKDLGFEFKLLVEAAHRLSEDVGRTVEEILETGIREPLPSAEARSLLNRVAEEVRAGVTKRNDKDGIEILDRDTEELIERIMILRGNLGLKPARESTSEKKQFQLQDFNGIERRAVKPSPVFHEREVAVNEGFVRTRDIEVWGENERIDIHLNQFRQTNDRLPNSNEVLDIMMGNIRLPGTLSDDQFEIRNLARSIAVNGVRKPPIIDIDGTLLDGNRRVTACHYILNSPDFSSEEKKRVEWLQVWQLTEHATDEERDSVIVSLNFEPDFKQDWPAYVKARKVHEDWQAMLALEPRANPNSTRQRELKQNIARRFALSVNDVNRYISNGRSRR